MRTGDVAGAIGRGMVAGVAGTALMTISSTIEMKLAGRQPSSAPADAAAKVLGVDPKAEAAEKARFATVVHWAYGTAWGALRGVLGVAGLSGPVAGGAHFAAVWGSGLVLPRLGVAPPVGKSGTRALTTDAFHHFVYAAGRSPAFAALQLRLNTRSRLGWSADGAFRGMHVTANVA